MDEITDSINAKNSNLLSRNRPVALVVGAAGFIGSHLVDKLLEKGIQVLGVDDLQNGEKRNLRKATEARNFHLLLESPEKIDLNLERLDYIFIVPSGEWNLEKILDLFKKHNCRCLFVSSIDLYEKDKGEGDLRWCKQTESKIAKFASEFNLNARVLRLGPVYGPRMQFKLRDPVIKLIQQALTGDLQKDVSLDFSSRALYISDSIDLIIKTMFVGSTAQKIFDGVLPSPVKVAEIKQVLLDPIWYESKDFEPSELPPWPTPNLEKTIKFLNWQPRKKFVSGLRETLSYFKDNEISVTKIEEKETKQPERQEENEWKKEKRAVLESFRGNVEDGRELKRARKGLSKISLSLSKIYLIAVLAIVGYAIIWPVLVLGWGFFTFKNNLSEGLKSLEKGQFERSLGEIQQAEIGAKTAESILVSLDPIRRSGLLKKEFEIGDDLISLSVFSASAARSTVLGTEALFQALRSVTGELTETPAVYFDSAQIELSAASQQLSSAQAILRREDFEEKLPSILRPRVNSLSEKLTSYNRLVNKAQAISVLLPNLVALEGSKSYLILLQNNMELRPAGGFIGSFAKVTFEGGRLKRLDVNDIYNIDGQLGIHVEPPKEIREDLGQKDWFLRDSNWESDFPTSARQAEWFFTRETGERVEGVIALDISAMEELLVNTGPLDLSDYNEKITPENMFEKAISHAELSFFPGSQAKKSFLTALTNQLFNKIFFLPQNNWPGIISSLGKSLDQKHISIYLNDPKLFSYVLSQNWAAVLPRVSDTNKAHDFLSVVEANLGANKVNYYLDRSFNLETVIGKDGEIKHRLRISYINRSPSDAFPGGKYKNRMRVYLPFGSKIIRVLWGEADITKDVSSFVDFGRTGYSLLLELSPKEQKNLVLDYEVPNKLEFKDGKASYRLDIVKQAGTLKDPLQWTVTYPISYQLVSDQAKSIGPQEQTISTDLSSDRSFEVEFKK